jgi:hypothetical protein
MDFSDSLYVRRIRARPATRLELLILERKLIFAQSDCQPGGCGPPSTWRGYPIPPRRVRLVSSSPDPNTTDEYAKFVERKVNHSFQTLTSISLRSQHFIVGVYSILFGAGQFMESDGLDAVRRSQTWSCC